MITKYNSQQINVIQLIRHKMYNFKNKYRCTNKCTVKKPIVIIVSTINGPPESNAPYGIYYVKTKLY